MCLSGLEPEKGSNTSCAEILTLLKNRLELLNGIYIFNTSFYNYIDDNL